MDADNPWEEDKEILFKSKVHASSVEVTIGQEIVLEIDLAWIGQEWKDFAQVVT